MPAARPLFPLAALALLAGCGGHEEDNKAAAANAQVSAEGKAEEGEITVKGAGVSMTFTLPRAMRGEAKAGKDSKILYPGSTIQGLALVGGEAKGKAGGEIEAEFSFTSPDPRDRVLAWYRDPGRVSDLHVTAVQKEGDDVVIQGTQTDKHIVKIRLAEKAGGGTAGRVTIHHND